MSAAVVSPIDEDGRVIFHCPGCGFGHGPWVRDGKRSKWEWNGSFDKPTFSPSLLVRWPGRGDDPDFANVCHSFIADGRIQFLPDCTHALAGQTVDLPPWDD